MKTLTLILEETGDKPHSVVQKINLPDLDKLKAAKGHHLANVIDFMEAQLEREKK